ncbi:hypothetical protein BC938DRAFT_481020 [Jimgerdemannia flammicorona]|uniref:Uncharacterized protein n=1 Tax=Jimgerdemannia flammicorona TaxID=994334 RepID=A0A433QHV7_9FUNG|nr:hypothetical protein BC938DRAFT_481020 [Jimgerdemannia flammicorona]
MYYLGFRGKCVGEMRLIYIQALPAIHVSPTDDLHNQLTNIPECSRQSPPPTQPSAHCLRDVSNDHGQRVRKDNLPALGDVIPDLLPYAHGNVPEGDRSAVGDVKGLPSSRRGRGGELLDGEDVGVGNVANVGEVHQAGVVAYLNDVLSALADLEEAGDDLAVARAEDTGGSYSAG